MSSSARKLRSCCCKTRDGRKCGREFYPQTSKQKNCWQHGGNQGYTCRKEQPTCSRPTYVGNRGHRNKKRSPPKRKRAVHFAKRVSIQKLPMNSNEKKARETVASARLTRAQSSCVYAVLGQHDIWDVEQLRRSSVSAQDRKLIRICLAILDGKSATAANYKLIKEEEKRVIDRVEIHTVQVLKKEKRLK